MKEAAAYFHCSTSHIKVKCREFNLPRKSKQQAQANVEKTVLSKYGAKNIFASDYGKSKVKCTFNEKYGVDNPGQLPDHAAKLKLTKLERYGDENYYNLEKAIATNQTKFGYDNAMQNPDIKAKSVSTKIDKYGCLLNKAKVSETCQEKYGVDWYTQSVDFKDKSSKTCQEKYGTDLYVCSEDYHQKITAAACELRDEYHKKAFVSKQEYKYLQHLLTLFDDQDVVWQYTDSRYNNYICDFYIVSLDLFIECHFHWTHGGRPYDPNSDVCIKQLAE